MNVMLDTKKEKEKKTTKQKFGKQSHHTISSMERKIFSFKAINQYSASGC